MWGIMAYNRGNVRDRRVQAAVQRQQRMGGKTGIFAEKESGFIKTGGSDTKTEKAPGQKRKREKKQYPFKETMGDDRERRKRHIKRVKKYT